MLMVEKLRLLFPWFTKGVIEGVETLCGEAEEAKRAIQSRDMILAH